MDGNDGKGSEHDGSDRTFSLHPRRARSPAAPFWLSINKVTVPDRVTGYVHRPGLLDRLQPTCRRVTVLKAPGGFGKTVLLGESCRDLRRAGTIAAWLTLDADDSPQILDAYLAFAFEQAGLNLVDAVDVSDIQPDRPGALERRARLLGMAVERHRAPCVLVLDELELLDDSASLALLGFLLNWGPPNLHFAIACREIPASLDIASPLFAGHGEIFSTDDLRFSRPDIVQLLGPGASRREIATAWRESSGWPIALRVFKNERFGKTREEPVDGTDIADNWVESRLMRGLSEAECDLLLDAGLFDWLDAGLLDAVLETVDVKRQLEAIPALAGLLESVHGEASNGFRLHSLIREHCARRRYRDTPDRFRRIHRRIAETLARRGDTVAAMRHAVDAADLRLAGEILENAGGARLWLSEGFARLQAADRLLTEELIEQRPRLALVRCMAVLLAGQLDEARRLYRAEAAKRPDSTGALRGEDMDYRLDDITTRGIMALYGCDSMGSEQVESLLAEGKHFVARDDLDPFTHRFFEQMLLTAHNLNAEFDAGLYRAERALRRAPAGHYLDLYVDLGRGQIAMARGEVAQAKNCYSRALKKVRESCLSEPGAAAFCEALMAELNLERNRIAGIQIASRSREVHLDSGTPYAFMSCAARSGVVLDLTWQRKGVDVALSAAEGMLDYARTASLAMLVRYLAAERVSLFVAGGRTGEAERAWRFDGLPERAADCLNLKGQSWRELEAVACAKLRLLNARGEFEAGRGFLQGLVSVASERDLWRTRMRALALGVALEHAAGRPAEAERHLNEFLRLFAQADYARPLVRERTNSRPVLEAFLANNADSPAAAAARRLLAMLTDSERRERGEPSFSRREQEVLQRLEAFSDKEIAGALALTPGGVRYHVGNIFAKLGARDRLTAVSRARQIGLLP